MNSNKSYSKLKNGVDKMPWISPKKVETCLNCMLVGLVDDDPQTYGIKKIEKVYCTVKKCPERNVV